MPISFPSFESRGPTANSKNSDTTQLNFTIVMLINALSKIVTYLFEVLFYNKKATSNSITKGIISANYCEIGRDLFTVDNYPTLNKYWKRYLP